ncbi:MAG: hypothetical protein AAF702_27265 [Chloroflexota bacterium]
MSRLTLFLILLFTPLLWPTSLFAASTLQEQAKEAVELRGELPIQYSKHFYGLKPLQMDGLVRLTLAYEPAGDRSLRGLISFVVLTDDGLRRHLAGDSLNSVSFARGNVLPYGAENVMETSFQSSGKGNYTVVVFNNLDARARYILNVDGGILVDDSGQSVEEFVDPPVQEAAAQASTAAAPVTAVRLTGKLEKTRERHYIGLRPQVRDGQVVLRYVYHPQNESSLSGQTNFYVIDDDGIRRIQSGEDPELVNIAAGSLLPFLPSNELYADFSTSGYGPYLAVIYNDSTIPAAYTLEIDGGFLEEQVGQTQESQAAVAELLALGETLPASPLTGEPSGTLATSGDAESIDAESLSNSEPSTSIALSEAIVENGSAEGSEAVPTVALFPPIVNETTAVGTIQQRGEQHYWTVEPVIADDVVVITLEYAPRNLVVPFEPVNFWVLDADGFRRVVAGERPQEINIAAGGPVQYGADKGNLRTIFKTSRRGPYTVVVTKSVDAEMQYMLRVKGGRLLDIEERLQIAEATP